MGRRGKGGGDSEGDLQRRESTGRIEQKFAPPEMVDVGRGARKTRRRRSLDGELEVELVDASLWQSGTIADAAAREGFSPALVTFVARMIRHGLEAGELRMVDGVVVAVEDVQTTAQQITATAD